MSVLDAEAAARFSTAAALDARERLAIPASGGHMFDRRQVWVLGNGRVFACKRWPGCTGAAGHPCSIVGGCLPAVASQDCCVCLSFAFSLTSSLPSGPCSALAPPPRSHV